MSSTHEPLSFDLELAEIPVTLNDPETGEAQEYVIRELTGKQRDAYLNGVSKRTKQLADGTTKVTNFDGLQGDLLSRCMFLKGEDKPVKLDVVQQWPAKVQSKLFEAARELSALGQEEGEESGND